MPFTWKDTCFTKNSAPFACTRVYIKRSGWIFHPHATHNAAISHAFFHYQSIFPYVLDKRLERSVMA